MLWMYICSGQDHIATQSKVAATRKQESPHRISVSMDFGPITTTDPIHQTVTRKTSSIHPKFPTLAEECKQTGHLWRAQAATALVFGLTNGTNMEPAPSLFLANTTTLQPL